METKALISVIIPNFNRGDLLKETLESVLKQSYPYWEAIVVDDGSTDNSESVGLEYALKDSRIKYYKRTKESGGAPVCRNIGIQKSTGDYLIFLDSDDLLASYCLEQRMNQITSCPENDFWVFPMLMFLGKPESACKLWNINTPEPDLHRFLKLDAVWQTSGPVWRKNAVIKINRFTEGLACWQDVDIHLKALISGLSYKKYYQLKPDVFYRQHETGSISQNEISSPAKMKSRKQIFLTHATNLIAYPDKAIFDSLRVLGTNVVIGAVKSLNVGIVNKVVVFGFRKKIFSLRFVIKAYFLLTIMLLRLNKFGFIAAFVNKMIKKRRIESTIGKHLYQQK